MKYLDNLCNFFSESINHCYYKIPNSKKISICICTFLIGIILKAIMFQLFMGDYRGIFLYLFHAIYSPITIFPEIFSLIIIYSLLNKIKTIYIFLFLTVTNILSTFMIYFLSKYIHLESGCIEQYSKCTEIIYYIFKIFYVWINIFSISFSFYISRILHK